MSVCFHRAWWALSKLSVCDLTGCGGLCCLNCVNVFSQDMMEALTTQNSELRAMLIKATEVKPRSGENGSENGDKSQTDDLVSFS